MIHRLRCNFIDIGDGFGHFGLATDDSSKELQPLSHSSNASSTGTAASLPIVSRLAKFSTVASFTSPQRLVMLLNRRIELVHSNRSSIYAQLGPTSNGLSAQATLKPFD
ncbi:hypothetical protein Dsin_027957 [Dipteronia sinensis]|uniref:Uncharacterized protein n=1 Tax=Dipteronia sinensis TaxID=43782 RepID=A0AAE0DU29_9ROSI|nr:hypothetical protein Dsin_027957 [Dipteronia sinensis]